MNIFKILPLLPLLVSSSLAGEENPNIFNHTYISPDGQHIIFETYHLSDLPMIPWNLPETLWKTHDGSVFLYFKHKVLWTHNLKEQKEKAFPFIGFSEDYPNCLIFLDLNNLVCLDDNVEGNQTVLFLFYRVPQLYFGDGLPTLQYQKPLYFVKRE